VQKNPVTKVWLKGPGKRKTLSINSEEGHSYRERGEKEKSVFGGQENTPERATSRSTDRMKTQRKKNLMDKLFSINHQRPVMESPRSQEITLSACRKKITKGRGAWGRAIQGLLSQKKEKTRERVGRQSRTTLTNGF